MNPGVIVTPSGIHVLKTDSHLSRWVENHGRLDISDGQIAFYSKYIAPGSTVIDAGACIGDYTATLSKLVGPSGHVLSIEPNPLAFECLRLNFSSQPNVRVINAALDGVAGNAMMKVEQNAGASYLSEGGNVAISCITIDALVCSRLDFIHLDCEGFELGALRGGCETIARFRPIIVLEVNHGCLLRNGLHEADVIACLDSMGYRVEEIEPHLNSSYPQRDIIAFPK